MAFGISRVRAFGIEAEEPLNKRYVQRLILDLTQAVADVDLDIGEYLTGALGTFWTAVTGTEPGDTALQALRDIVTRADSLIGFGGDQMTARLRVATGASASAADYEAIVVNGVPSFTYTAPQSATQTVVLEWLLGDDQAPVEVDASA